MAFESRRSIVKHIVGVSIGSSERDHKSKIELLGEEVVLERIGTDGDINKAVEIIKELDGKVDAFGMGGIDLYLAGATKQYIFREAKKIARAAVKTPLVDGTGLKTVLEPMAVDHMKDVIGYDMTGKDVLLVCAVDRIGLAEAFVRHGANLVCGDLIFSIGIPLEIKSIRTLKRAASMLLPMISKLPFKWVYPSGEKQDQHKSTNKYSRYYNGKDIIAGDFHFINKYIPEKVEGQVIVTNTVTAKDVEDLKKRGASMLVTTTPHIDGRSYGTNVIEAMLVSFIDKPKNEITPEDYKEMIRKMEIKPSVIKF